MEKWKSQLKVGDLVHFTHESKEVFTGHIVSAQVSKGKIWGDSWIMVASALPGAPKSCPWTMQCGYEAKFYVCVKVSTNEHFVVFSEELFQTLDEAVEDALRWCQDRLREIRSQKSKRDEEYKILEAFYRENSGYFTAQIEKLSEFVTDRGKKLSKSRKRKQR